MDHPGKMGLWVILVWLVLKARLALVVLLDPLGKRDRQETAESLEHTVSKGCVVSKGLKVPLEPQEPMVRMVTREHRGLLEQ